MQPSIFDIQAEFCKAMGHPVRLRILHLLREGPMSVGNLVRQLELPQSLVSRQLHVLRYGGIVTGDRRATEVIYRLSDVKIGEVCDLVRQMLAEKFQRHSETILK
jgi:ArsR family transcriptional regulator, arsenate/arsenite/antimonite-responsive transcriptional repressor